MIKIKYVLPILFIFIFTGCISTKTLTYQKALKTDQLITSDEYNDINISRALIKHFKEWRGVKYKYAGNSKKGVDCSYFVQDALKSSINFNVPRTTLYQSKMGYEVNDLKTGDLVFFNTGYKVRHVGIYLNKGHFVHVSTSKGVIISRLDNPYWKSHYWKTQRVIK